MTNSEIDYIANHLARLVACPDNYGPDCEHDAAWVATEALKLVDQLRETRKAIEEFGRISGSVRLAASNLEAELYRQKELTL